MADVLHDQFFDSLAIRLEKSKVKKFKIARTYLEAGLAVLCFPKPDIGSLLSLENWFNNYTFSTLVELGKRSNPLIGI